ncbi:MAG: hypothetical protein ACM3JJ_10730 [Hyphomicrobiales bacterium]
MDAMGIAKAKETDMKTFKWFALAALAGVVLLGMSGCTSTSTRAILTVESVNGGNVFYSDLVSDSGQVVADAAKVVFGNIQNDGGAPLEPGSPFSEIVVTGYTVTYDDGIYPPVSAGLTAWVPSGGTAEASIAMSDLLAKASVPTTTAVSTTARIKFTGFVHTNGGNNGDRVEAHASVPVVVANFKDADVPKN